MKPDAEQEKPTTSGGQGRDFEDALLDSIADDPRFDSGVPDAAPRGQVIPFSVRTALLDIPDDDTEPPAFSLDALADFTPDDEPESYSATESDAADSAMGGLRSLIDELQTNAETAEVGAKPLLETPAPAEPTEADELLNELNALKADLAKLQTLTDEEEAAALDAESSVAPANPEPEIECDPSHSVWQRLQKPEQEAEPAAEPNEEAPESDLETEAVEEQPEIAGPILDERFVEARKLMNELNRDEDTEPELAPGLPPETNPPVSTLDDHAPEPVYSYDTTPRRRSISQRRGTGWLRWVKLLAVFAVVAGVGALAYKAYSVRGVSPESLMAKAQRDAARRDWASAAAAYTRFANRYPAHSLAAEALYGAGHAQYVLATGTNQTDDRAIEKAFQTLDRFVQENPGHPKASRAAILSGILQYDRGEYQDAIVRLEAPGRRLEDPTGHLPGLRALARSYAALGQIDRARTTFLEAAAVTENVTPDQDFLELAAYYRRLSEDPTRTPAERERFARAAIEQWENALATPGLVGARKKEIRLMRDVVAAQNATVIPERELN